MKILTVIPIAKGIPRDELSYFSAKEVAVGTLVTVPFGKRSIKGVVVDQNEVRDLKASLKENTFALRNVTTVHADAQLPSGIFQVAQSTAHFFAQKTGPVLETMLPNAVFEHYVSKGTDVPPATRLHPDIQTLQLPLSERIATYRTLVRENLGKHRSTIIVTPSVIQAEKIAETLSTGIEDRIFVLHSRKTKVQLAKLLPAVLDAKHPVVLIATAPYASMVRSDWETVVIEQSASPYYRYSFGPVFDMRFFLEHVARYFGARLIHADILLDVSIRGRIANREITDLRSTWHIAKPEDFQIIDMKEVEPMTPSKMPFRMLHRKTVAKITEAVARKSNTVFLTTRKGLAPLTACSDCGTAVSCPNCGTPLVLHRKQSKSENDAHPARTYLCHHCMHSTVPIDRCANCGSWKLTMLGVSVEGIIEELDRRFPAVRTYQCDGDTTTTPAAIRKTLKAWQDDAGSFLVATPFIIPYLDTVDFGCIVSMDSLLSIPSYTGAEHGLHTALSFLEKISTGAIFQTRNAAHQVIASIAAEDVFGFTKSELDSRAMFGYPPAKVLIKISLEVKKSDAREANDYLEKIFKEWSPDIIAKKSRVSDMVIIQAMLRVDPKVWDDGESSIHHVIEELPPEFLREVNPETVL